MPWAASTDDLDVAEALIDGGADVHARPSYAERTPREIAGSLDTRRETLVTWLRELGA